MASPPIELDFFHGNKQQQPLPQQQWQPQLFNHHQGFCQTIPHVALSLKSRESSAMALKHIFDRIQGNQCSNPNPAPSPPAQERDRNFGTQICQDSANPAPFGSPIATTPHFQPNPPMPQPATAQLTIFYSGTVSVYDEVPVDKAHAIMLLAGNGYGHGQSRPSSEAVMLTPARPVNNQTVNSQTVSSGSQPAVSVGAVNSQNGGMCIRPAAAVNGQLSSPLPAPVSALPSTSENKLQSGAMQPLATNPSELPHARKASLARFLEKRKDRVQLKPAEIGTEAEGKGEEEKAAKRACSRSRSSSPSAQEAPSTSRCDSPSLPCDQEEQNT